MNRAKETNAKSLAGRRQGPSEKKAIVCHLQEMFASRIDPEVVRLTLEDCNFNVNVAIENLLFASGSDNDLISVPDKDLQQPPLPTQSAPLSQQIISSSSPPDPEDAVVTLSQQTDEEEEEEEDLSSNSIIQLEGRGATGGPLGGGASAVGQTSQGGGGGAQQTKYLVDYRDKSEDDANGIRSFYGGGNRISTIYKSNEGLYTEDDVTNGDLDHPSRQRAPPTVITTDNDDDDNLPCLRGFPNAYHHLGDQNTPDSPGSPWDVLPPNSPKEQQQPRDSYEKYHYPPDVRLQASLIGPPDFQLQGALIGSPDFQLQAGLIGPPDVRLQAALIEPLTTTTTAERPRQRRRRGRTWDTTSGLALGDLQDGFSPDSDKSVEADASESFGEYQRQQIASNQWPRMDSGGGATSKQRGKQFGGSGPAVARTPSNRQSRPGQPQAGAQVAGRRPQAGAPGRQPQAGAPGRQPQAGAPGRQQHQQQSCKIRKQVVSRIQKGDRILILLRGLPGSGKSTLARELKHQGVILSTDDYFFKNGRYEYDPSKLGEAHNINKNLTRVAMQKSRTPIVIDNTNLEFWEMVPYVSEALQFSYAIYCLEPETAWRYDLKQLAAKNTHNVGQHKIAHMMQRFDTTISTEWLVRQCRHQLVHQDQHLGAAPHPAPRPQKTTVPRHISRVEATAHKKTNATSDSSQRSQSKTRDTGSGPKMGTGRHNDSWTNQNSGGGGDKLWKSTSVPNLHKQLSVSSRDDRDTNDEEEENLMWWSVDDPETEPNQTWTTKPGDWDNVVQQDEFATQKAQQEPKMDGPQHNSKPPPPPTRPRRPLAPTFKDLKSDWKIPKYPEHEVPRFLQSNNDNCQEPESKGLLVPPPLGRDDEGHFELQAAIGSMDDLKSYFPKVPVEQLQDIYDKCRGDMHWILDLLLDSGYDISQGALSGNGALQHSGSSIEGLADIGSTDGSSMTGSALTDSLNAVVHLEPSKSLDSSATSAQDTPGNLILHIDPIFAMQLQKAFGPSEFHLSPASYYGTDLNITITPEVARAIHRCWTDSLVSKFDAEEEELKMMSALDESYARRLQEEEDAKLAAILHSDPLGEHFPPLRDNDYTFLTAQENPPSKTTDLSSRIKRRQLYETFPKIDKKALDEVFEANDGSYAETVKAVQMSYGPNDQPKVVIAPEHLEEYERAMMELAQQHSLLSEVSQSDAEVRDGPEDPLELTYANLRAEASLHYQLRKECFGKAKEAYGRGLLAAASFYAEQGHQHSAKFYEANKRAKDKILMLNNMASRPDTLDLHKLHVHEALAALNQFLESKKLEMARKGQNQMTLYIITGRGTHSSMGQAKIRPAVIEHLVKQGIGYWEAGAGYLEVTVVKSKTKK